MSYTIAEWMTPLRAELKSRGISQSRAAKDLNISLPTLKRWLSGNGLTLERFDFLLKYLDLSLLELANHLPKKAKFFEYSVEQENFLATHARDFAFFDQLLTGKSPRRIAAESKLTIPEIQKVLARLERHRFLTWLPNDKIILSFKGEPKWRKNGPLSKAFRQSSLDQLLRMSDEQNLIGFFDLLEEDQNRFHEKIKELKFFLNQAEARSRTGSETTPVTLAILTMDQKPDFFSIR